MCFGRLSRLIWTSLLSTEVAWVEGSWGSWCLSSGLPVRGRAHPGKVPSLNRPLNVVEGFECSNDPRGYVVWDLNASVESPMANRLWVMGQTKSSSRHLHEDHTIEACDIARYGGAGVPPWSQAWGRASSESPWWLGCSSWDPAGPSPNERREDIPQWAYHLQEEP
ncbi:hypothetical protein ATANTOWER_010739 [Ataeniobius toweri]|uniref:Secreted protein n=1 Tax=Ataeniobius toweri TaxID=208326 RepID=A0ABU7A5J4_9TELE|nr:hypothetical protein [Ataeniobius toweri]